MLAGSDPSDPCSVDGATDGGSTIRHARQERTLQNRLLLFLRRPRCAGELELVPTGGSRAYDAGAEITEALLTCSKEHWLPVGRGIPRMSPDSLEEHWLLFEQPVLTP